MRKNRFSTRLSSGVFVVAIAATGEALITHGVSQAATTASTPEDTKTTTTTQLMAYPTSSATYGSPVTLTATISPATEGGVVHGMVQFMDGGTPLNSPATVIGNSASTTTSALEGGKHSLTAVFIAKDKVYDGSQTTPFMYTVTQRPTMLESSDGSVAVLSPSKVTFVAKLTDDRGVPLPEHPIDFKGGGQVCHGYTGQDGVVKCATGTITESQIAGIFGGYDVEFAGDNNYYRSTQHVSTKLGVASSK